MTHPITPGHVPAGSTPEGDGILVGGGPVRVDVFIDFQCPVRPDARTITAAVAAQGGR